MNGVGIFFIVLVFVVILPSLAWVGYTRWRAHQQGLPAPPLSAYVPFYKSGGGSRSQYPVAPRPGGIAGWVQDKVAALKGSRGDSGGGGSGGSLDASYGAARSGRGRGGFTQLDPDGAWDDRVGHEAEGSYGRVGDYEEQELGVHPAGARAHLQPGAGGGYRRPGDFNAEYEEPRGRSRSRDDLGSRPPGEGQHYAPYGGGEDAHERSNPFGDGAEPSELRGVSPRPVEMDAGDGGLAPHGHGKKDSGGSSRRSIFQESL